MFDFIDQLPQGSRYRAAQLQDPAVVDFLASQPDDKERAGAPSIESWNPWREDMARLTDVALAILFATAHDKSTPPRTPRPEYPHVLRKKEIRSAGLRELDMILVPHEFEAGDD